MSEDQTVSDPAAEQGAVPVGDQPAPVVEAAPPERGVPATRAGRVWVAIVVSIVLLILLLVFIFQNLHDARIHYFTATGSFPLALALLISAIVGALIVVLVGSVRILQLRRTVRTSRRRARAGRNATPSNR